MSDNKSKYVKLDHREHVLKRSETYVGSKVTEKNKMYVIENNNLSDIKVVKKDVQHNPAFIKLFDEILTNASDHSIRTGKVKMIKIVVDDKKISVENDGPTVEIALHESEGVYNPELIFGHLLTGENYDDDEERAVGGRNGLGAKLTNIFSKKFIVECCDGKQRYKQVFKDNMLSIGKPEIINTNDSSYTKITYYTDYNQFDFDTLTEDLKSIIYKRCLDVAAYIPGVRISLNGKTLPIKKLSDYMKMHLPEDAEFFYEELGNGWKVGVAKSTGHSFEQVSIVNGISTHRGGTHTNYMSLQLSKDISDKFPKKIKASWMDVKNKLFLFLFCEVINPMFDTQTKENLTNRMSTEVTKGSKVSDKTIKKIMKSEIVQSILDEIELREKLSLKRMSSGKKKTIKMDKLIDANRAGTKDSVKCSLILTEGDCMREDTDILILRDGGKQTVQAKELKIGDGVITHNSNVSVITSLTKKIDKGYSIKTKLGDMFFGNKHKLFIYDTVSDEFRFEKVSNIDKQKHKLVKNRNVFFDKLVKIDEILELDSPNDDKYNKLIKIGNEEILSSNSHKFCCFNISGQYFKMIKCIDINVEEWLLVNYEKI